MMTEKEQSRLPLVYSCSGCSSAAQLANHLAVKLDREKKLEMSCIAGVGGDVPALVRVAKSGRPIVAIDGCPLKCAQNCLKRHGVAPTLHFALSDFSVRKTYHEDFDQDDADRVYSEITEEIKKQFPGF